VNNPDVLIYATAGAIHTYSIVKWRLACHAGVRRQWDEKLFELGSGIGYSSMVLPNSSQRGYPNHLGWSGAGADFRGSSSAS
jgi:hypothetical protein